MGDRLPKVVVSGLVEKDGKVLLVKEILESKLPYWIVPGGKVEFGESLVDAVKRELKEETNLDVEVLRLLDFKEHIVMKYDYHTVVFFFLVKPLNESIKLPGEILDAKFFAKDELKSIDLVDSAKWILDKFFTKSA
ncbi:MAG: NUDIX hydrolase [Candidatus Woesearchaeota archaeon]|nr:NUDIX hydrolase [Candidatus Woesearchaeota archaeon]